MTIMMLVHACMSCWVIDGRVPRTQFSVSSFLD